MDRRAFLAGTAGTAALGLAGCLDRFETRSAWEQPPLVEDRPDAVYLPPAIEQMGTYGVHEVDGLRIGLFYTFPHRFWVVTGEDDSLVTIGDADVMHLMASVWDPDTGLVPPAEIAAEVRSGGERHQNYQLWPMLSQRMGFHYGDNVTFDEEGRYEIELRVDPTTARTSGAVDGVFAERASTVFEVEYASTDVLDLEFEFIDRDRRGDPGAVSLMVADHDHGEDGHDDTSRHDGDHEHPPPLQAPPGSALPGELYDLGSTGDARFLATVDRNRGTEDDPYLAVSPRTPHNRLSLPMMGLSVLIERDGRVAVEDRLTESLDDRLGHHYGRAVDLRPGDEVTVRIDAPPQVSRHDGYETAFFGMEDRTFEYQG